MPDPFPGEFPMWVIYERPIDAPNSYVVRRHVVLLGSPSRAEVDRLAHFAPTLEEARKCVPPGKVNIGRLPGDEPQIAEVWV